MMIILDFASATTCKNDIKYVERMIDELAAVDSGKHEVIIKWQLFTVAAEDCQELDPPVEPLRHDVFNYAYWYARKRGYQTTASVFDKESLDYLLTYDIPFVKLANRPDLYWLAGEVPRRVDVFVSVRSVYDIVNIHYEKSVFGEEFFACNTTPIACVSEYPAQIETYEEIFPYKLGGAVSDHTTDFELYHKYKPEIIEWHYKLSDSTGYDAGLFARTPEQLKEVL